LSLTKWRSVRGITFFGYASERCADFSAEFTLSPPKGLEMTTIRRLRMGNSGGHWRQFLFACDILAGLNAGI